MQFEHHASLSCIKHICRFKNCNRFYSNKKTLKKHKRHCKHFEGTVLESEIFQKSNINVKEVDNIFHDTVKLESEHLHQTSSLNKTNFELVNIYNNNIESNNNDTVFKKDLNIETTQKELRIFALKMISLLQLDAALSRVQINRITRIFHLFLNTNCKYFKRMYIFYGIKFESYN